MSVCRNCGEELHGGFCHKCGQKASGAIVTVRDLIHEGLHEFAHFDGKIFQTLRLLVSKPGVLTTEFLAGRRARYVSPLRLYLTCSLLFFALSAVAPNSLLKARITTDDVDSPADRLKAEQALEAVKSTSERIAHNTPRSMFVLMPVFGLLSWSFYRRQQPYYVPHLYYAVHFHAFVFLMLAGAKLWSFAGSIGGVVGGLFVLAILPYHYMALRRVFGGSFTAVALKGTAILVLYTLVVGAIVAAILAMTLMRQYQLA